jgi:hypothetical protein
MRHAFRSVATPDIYQMLNHHRLITRCCPHDRCGQPRRLRKRLQKVRPIMNRG